VPALDGVRAVAILLVLLIHFQIVPKSTLIERSLFFATALGWTGVDLFFVLSGYLITSILLASRQSTKYFGSFYARRVLRIFPLYYCYLVILLCGAAVIHPPRPVFYWSAVWYFLYLQNAVMAYAGTLGGLLSITWSLAVEEQYYLIWPIVVRTLRVRRLAIVLAAMLLAAPLLRAYLCFVWDAPLASYVLMPCRMDSLAAGGVVAILRYCGPLQRWRSLAWVGIALGGSLTALVAAWQGGFDYLSKGSLVFGLSALAIAYASALLLVLTTPEEHWFQRLLSVPWLRAIGRYSYAMYLLHFLIRALMRRAFPFLADAETVPRVMGTQWIAQGLFYVVAGALTVAGGWLSWHLVEKRILLLKARWRYEPVGVGSAAPE
jgi:peptidoglycan/LPS O-acetylase OafA/YrhL